MDSFVLSNQLMNCSQVDVYLQLNSKLTSVNSCPAKLRFYTLDSHGNQTCLLLHRGESLEYLDDYSYIDLLTSVAGVGRKLSFFDQTA